MIDLLKMALSAVATKDMVQVLTHFCIYRDLLNASSRLQASNGVVSIDVPFDHDIIDCTVPAGRFLKAVEACDGEPTFGRTEGGKLSIKRNRFKAYLPVLPVTDFPRAACDGEEIPVPPGLVAKLRLLKPFVSEDASRTWSTSALLKEGYAYAANNIILMRTPLAWTHKGIAFPIQLIDRLLEINDMPDRMFIGPSHVCFQYGDAWLRSQLIIEGWPSVDQLIENSPRATEELPEGLKAAIEKIQHFCGNEKFPIIRIGDVVQTEAAGEQGAAFEGFALAEAVFTADHLLKALSVATHMDFGYWPNPCPVKGLDIEGLIIGIKTS